MTSQSKPTRESFDNSALRRSNSRPTSYDVAQRAGVSQSTVSRVFRDGASVAKATRKKVEIAARALDYSPSLIARSLITQRSNMIAVVITDPSNRAYPEILFYLGQKIQQTGNRMLVFALPHETDATDQLRNVLAYQVDGVISCATLSEDFLISCQETKVPVVLFNRMPPNGLASAVSCDHIAGMGMLIRHLEAKNLGKVALLAGPENASVSGARLTGAKEALTQAGHGFESVTYSDYTYEGGRQAAIALMEQPLPPRTIICANDAMALGVMDACRFDLGLTIPKDVAVTGFDDIPQAAWPSYALTTLRQPVRRMTETAVRMLMEQISGTAMPGERRFLPAEIRSRGSA